MREELTNKISEDILKAERTNWENVLSRVNSYAELLEWTVRNFYEIQMKGGPCPLFALCYCLKAGKDNFGYNDEEFAETLKELEEETNKKFGVNIREMGYDK